MELEYILKTWEDFATVKRWKQQLSRKSNQKKLANGTYRLMKYYMPKFIECCKTNPDDLIEEAVRDSDLGEVRIDEFYHYMIDTKKIEPNTAHTGAYGVIRGFYRHNKIHTQDWVAPKPLPRSIDQTDAQYPMFVIQKRKTDDGKSYKKLVLNRVLLQKFMSKLNKRDQVILLCLISSGLDIGDLFKLTVGFVRNQQYDTSRLYLSSYRQKSHEPLMTFFSKEATKKLRDYVKTERKHAVDDDPLFVELPKYQKQLFKKTHGRKFTNTDIELLPNAEPVWTITIDTNFRSAAEGIDVVTQSHKQSPLRPKRFRKVFRSACQNAGIGDDMTRLFLGQTSTSSKVYLGKTREELEYYYELVEPNITINNDELLNNEYEKLQQQNKELDTKLKSVSEMEERMKAIFKKIDEEQDRKLQN